MPATGDSHQPAVTAPTAKPKTSVAAMWSLVLGIWGFLVGITAIPGVILGHLALYRTGPGMELRGRALAIAGTSLSWIALFAVLTGIVHPFGGFTLGDPQMDHVWAQKTATELRMAIMSYYSEYKRWPTLPSFTKDASGDDRVDSRNGDLLEALLGISNGSGAELNPRGIQFFSARVVKVDPAPGIWRDPLTGRFQLNDPWGNPFQIKIDTNLDNMLTVPGRTGSDTEVIDTNVAVWSFGKNGVEGGGKGRNDDIIAY